MLSKMSLKTYNYINIFTLGLLSLGAIAIIPVVMTIPVLVVKYHIIGMFAFFVIPHCIFETFEPENKNITRVDNILTKPNYKNIETTFIEKYVTGEFITDQIWKIGVFITLFSFGIGLSIAVIGIVGKMVTGILLLYKSRESKK